MSRRIFINIPRVLCHFNHRQQHNMAKCIARNREEERMNISFEYGATGARPKTFSFDRLKSEEIQVAIQRMKKNITAKLSKKKKKSKKSEDVQSEEKMEEDSVDLPVSFEINGSKIEENSSIGQVCVPGAFLWVGEQKYEIEIDPPTVKTLKLPKNLMIGFPVYPKIDLENSELGDSKFIWHRVEQCKKSTVKTEVGKGFTYIPNSDDLGHSLSVTCTPKNGGRFGEEETILSKETVGAGPGQCPFEVRHLFTSEPSREGCFRVVTYNILADCYADTEFTKTTLYPYCASYALSLDYRKQLLLKELQGYNADVICLQEVDRRVFNNELVSVLTSLGFQGCYKEKQGSVREGEAIFYRTSKFRLLGEHNINLTEQLKSDPKFSHILKKVSTSKAVMTELEQRGTVLQVAVLESIEEPGRKLCVANTHLFFHRDADHIRVIQGATCLAHLQHVLETEKEKDDDLSLIFCGDFNANPKSALYQFMTSGGITEEHHHLTVKGTGEKLESSTFQHNLSLRNACGEQRYTNYVGGFHAVLDYMFIDRSINVTNVVPMPTHEEVIQCVALPSVVFPSDHIAQICDLTWK
ncbi:hypothetical protein FSP39_007770 [Pinctada imbricata]|uniref:2',5'-phosphodiesterase 12 n=1 Tax=Pinctada imbricata TaxID=66713 RepID=A0AA88XQN8_PINIB|nr:hypothetical protein FSP39_007770 [Pinctada imbricata]